MKHKMNLHDEPYKLIDNESKTIELRLNDEKRNLIRIKDLIEFTNKITGEQLLTEVINLHKFNNFDELYQQFNKIVMGYKENEEAKPADMELYYSKEDQNKYGVVGIEIKKCK